MASLFGDDSVADLLNDNVQENHDLPSDDDQPQAQGEENALGEDGEAAATDADGNPVKLEPKKRSVRNPRPRLTVQTLSGPRGIQTIEDYYKDIKFRGKGHEKQDLDEVMHRLQHWAHRMYPNYKFDDVLMNIERLGKKKPLHVHMSRYRLGMLEHMKLIDQVHEDDDEVGNAEAADEPFDEFDALLGEQIAISKLAPRTPGPHSSRSSSSGITPMTNSTLATPSFSRGNAAMSTPYSGVHNFDDSDLAQPLPPSQPSTPAAKQLSSEQLARIAENRRIALERLQATKQRLQQQKQEESQNAEKTITEAIETSSSEEVQQLEAGDTKP